VICPSGTAQPDEFVDEHPVDPFTPNAARAWRPDAGTDALLATLLAAVFMTTADNSIVNVAVPSISASLDASGGDLELVVAGYMLAYAALLITGARLGALYGYRRVFLIGLVLFTLASLACGLAFTAAELVVARIVQGVGAALMVPQVLTGIQLNFEGTRRGRALAFYPVALAGGAAAGQALGGVLIAWNLYGTGWRSVFLVNVPLGLLLVASAARRLPRDEPPRGERLDLQGVAALTALLLLIVLPLTLGRDHSWPLWVWVSLLASLPAAAVLIAIERHVARGGGHPVLQLRLFRSAAVSWGLTAQAAATVTYASLLFVLALYLQQGLGRTPLYSGLTLLSWVAGFGLSGPVLRALPERLTRHAATAGFALLALALLGIGLERVVSTPAGLPLIVLLGFGGLGMGVGFSSLIGHLTNNVPRELASDLSGAISTNSETFSALGVACFGTAYLALAHPAGTTRAVDALGWVAIALGASALLAALAAQRTTRADRPTASAFTGSAE
jgi:MFS family permease